MQIYSLETPPASDTYGQYENTFQNSTNSRSVLDRLDNSGDYYDQIYVCKIFEEMSIWIKLILQVYRIRLIKRTVLNKRTPPNFSSILGDQQAPKIVSSC